MGDPSSNASSNPYGGGFLSGVYSVIQPKLDQARKEDAAQRQMEHDFWWKAAHDPALAIQPTDDEPTKQRKAQQLQMAQDNLLKLQPKANKPLLQRVLPLVQHVFGHKSAANTVAAINGQPEQPDAAAATVPPPPGAAVAATPDATGIMAQPARASDEQDYSAGRSVPSPSSPAASEPASAGAVSSPAPSNVVGTGATTLAPPPAMSAAANNPEEIPKLPGPAPQPTLAQNRKPAIAAPPSYSGADVAYTMRQDQQANALDFYKKQQEILAGFKMQELEAMAKARSLYPSSRPVMGPQISVANARQLQQDQGKEYIGQDGQPIDLSTLPDGMGLKNIIWGGHSFYAPFSPNQKTITVGNEVIAVSPMDVTGVPTGSGTNLGAKQVPRTTTKEYREFGSTSTSTPVTTGARQASPAVPPPPGAKNPVGTGGGATRPATAPAASSSALGDKVYSPQAQAQKMAAVPVREAATQILGDPADPSFKSLIDYAPVFDDPKARTKLAKAITLTLDGMDGEITKEGGIWNLITTKGGLPQALASARAAVQSGAIQGLSPEERQLYDTIMTAYSNVIGLRSLTKASAAQFSIKQLENELPVPGRNTVSSAQFYDQLSKLGKQIENGSKVMSDTAMKPEEKKFIHDRVRQLSALAAGKSIAPPPGGGKPAKSTADEIMQLVGAEKKH